MNRQRLLDIAAHIEAEPQTFDMATVLNECGTVGCIMGQAIMLFDRARLEKARKVQLIGLGAPSLARELLGLSEDDAQELFYAESLDVIDDGVFEEYGYDVVENNYRALVPAALRWMIANDAFNWEQALFAVGADI